MNRDIFISYRRQGGFETALYLYEHLKADGYTVTFDLDTLRSGRFDKALLRRIENATDFIVILSRDCFKRTLDPGFPQENDWLRCELAHAIAKKKNIITIQLAGFAFPEKLPDDIDVVRYMNGPSYSQEYIDAFYERTKTFLLSKPASAKAPSQKASALSSSGLPPKKSATTKRPPRRKKNAADIIFDEFSAIREEVGSDLYLGRDIPDIKVKWARNEWNIPERTVIPALFDPTITGGLWGLDGFAATPKGVFIKENEEAPRHVKWSEINSEDTGYTDDSIIVAGYSLGTYLKEDGNRALITALLRCREKIEQ